MQYKVDPTDQAQENGQKPLLWLFGSFKNAFSEFWMILHDLVMLKNVKYYPNMQYQVNPINQSWENSRYLIISFKNTLSWFLNDQDFSRKNAQANFLPS